MICERLNGALMRAAMTLALMLSVFVMSTPANANARHIHHHHHQYKAHHPRQHNHRVVWRHVHFSVDQFNERVASQIPPNPFDALSDLMREGHRGALMAMAPIAPLSRELANLAVNGTAAALVRASAEAHHVPVAIALALTRFESGFRMHMRGAAGERGAMQVLPQTARHVGVYGNLYGPAGIEAGMRYLHEALAMQGRYGLCAAISAYNHGIGRVYCSSYGRTVLALAHGVRRLRDAVILAGWHQHHSHHHHHAHRWA